jgi:NhaP-type Na+/H+ or K+/H+ antiporter
MNSNDYYWGWENAVGLLLLMFVLAIAFIPPQQLHKIIQQIIQQLLNGLIEGAIMGAVIALAIVVTILLIKKHIMKEEVDL